MRRKGHLFGNILRKSSPLVRAGLVVGSIMVGLACGREIGDDCETNVQCSTRGNRQCDLSQPGGYCTVIGCDNISCPDESLCVRFFPPQSLRMDRRCDPATEVATPQCNPREICIEEGFCIEPRLEQRYCMKSCTGDHECRGEYQCRRTGEGGAELLPNSDGTSQMSRGFCGRRT